METTVPLVLLHTGIPLQLSDVKPAASRFFLDIQRMRGDRGYSLIQFKEISGQLMVQLIGRGVLDWEHVQIHHDNRWDIRGRNLGLDLRIGSNYEEPIGITGDYYVYRLNNYMAIVNKTELGPANEMRELQHIITSKGLQKIIELDTISFGEARFFLGRLLCRHISYVLHALALPIPTDQIEVEISPDHHVWETDFKGEKYLFDIGFISNIRLPLHLGLGHAIRSGYGQITRRTKLLLE